jgi:threonine dehydratase
MEDAPDLDVLIVPIGGGGLIAGTAIAAKALKPLDPDLRRRGGDVSVLHRAA